MPIPDPWSTEQPGSTAAETGPNGAPEPAPAPERARVYDAEETGSGPATVVPLRGDHSNVTDRDDPAVAGRTRAAWQVWVAEARESATAAVDGSVWRARPPALRDIHARAQRAEWAGESNFLRMAGQGFGYVSLVITALGYALLWVARRPSRLALTVLIAVLVVVLAI